MILGDEEDFIQGEVHGKYLRLSCFHPNHYPEPLEPTQVIPLDDLQIRQLLRDNYTRIDNISFLEIKDDCLWEDHEYCGKELLCKSKNIKYKLEKAIDYLGED